MAGKDNGPLQVLRSVFYGAGEHNLANTNGGITPAPRYLYVFHNTFDGRDLADKILLQWQSNLDSDLHIKNNIIYTDDAGAYGQRYEFNPFTNDKESDYNLYHNSGENPWSVWLIGGDYTLSAICSSYGRECNAVEGNPLLTDADDRDYALSSNSPAIDSGGWLTTITSSSGSGTRLKVDDSYWFYDGWDIQGETGDTVMTQSGQKAIITSIDYATDTITLDRSISWTQGEGFTLDYSGSRPDMGAYEYEGSSPPACTPNWQCSDWSSCSQGTQTRTCTDLNSCGTTQGKPPESQSCTGCSTDPDCPSGQLCCSGSCQDPSCSSDSDCSDADPCTSDSCLQPGTCSASCSHTPVTACTGGDSCCPAGCTQETDPDCEQPGCEGVSLLYHFDEDSSLLKDF